MGQNLSAIEYLLLVSAIFQAGNTWIQWFLILCQDYLEFMCRCALRGIKSSLFCLSCSWQSFRTGTLERSSSYLCLLIRVGCPIHPVCRLSFFSLIYIRIRASNAVQMKHHYLVHLTRIWRTSERSVVREGWIYRNLQVHFHSWIPVAAVHKSFSFCQLL